MNNLPELIEKEVKGSDLNDLSLVQTLASNFVPFISEVQDQSDLLKNLRLGNADDMGKAKRIALDLGKIRSRKDKVKKEQKDYYLKVGRFIDSLSNTVEGMITLTQDEANTHVKYFENLEKQRLEKLKEERLGLVRPYITVDPVGLEIMTDDVFKAYLSGVKRNYEAEQEAIRKAEEDRERERVLSQLALERHKMILPYKDFFQETIDLKNASEKEFKSYLKTLQKRKADFLAEQEAIRSENERLKEEARLKAIEAKKVLERIEKEHQREKLLLNISVQPWPGCMELSDEEFGAIYTEKKRAYNEEQDRIKKAIEEEEARKAEEERIAWEAGMARKEAEMAPDREKLLNAIESINIDSLTISTNEGFEVYAEVIAKLNSFKSWANKLVNEKL